MASTASQSSALFGTSNDKPDQALHRRWAALHEKSAEIAQIADLAPEALEHQVSRFNDALSSNSSHLLDTAGQGLEDMELLVDMGLAALKEVEARGQAAHAPALALWREFYHAREAVLSVMEPTAA